jgi:hypothetical protein
MTVIEIMPTTRWRESYPAPKDVALENGPWCPMQIRTPLLTERHGWVCVHCGAYWDHDGRHGRWLTAAMLRLVDGCLVERDTPTPAAAAAPVSNAEPLAEPTAEAVRLCRVDRAVTGAIVAGAALGGGFATGHQLLAGTGSQDLMWTVSMTGLGALLIAVALVLAWHWRQGRQDAGEAGA